MGPQKKQSMVNMLLNTSKVELKSIFGLPQNMDVGLNTMRESQGSTRNSIVSQTGVKTKT